MTESTSLRERVEQWRTERYGIQWRGATEPISVALRDGYWTPWHLADALVRELVAEIDTLQQRVEMAEQDKGDGAEDFERGYCKGASDCRGIVNRMDALTQERDEAIERHGQCAAVALDTMHKLDAACLREDVAETRAEAAEAKNKTLEQALQQISERDHVRNVRRADRQVRAV